MAKGVKVVREVDLEWPWSGKRAKSIMIQSVIERPKPHVEEIIIYSLVILLLTTETYWRNKVWNSEIKLWTDCVKKSPKKERPHNNLGFAFLNQGNYQEAIAYFTETLRIKPNLEEMHYNLGKVYLTRN